MLYSAKDVEAQVNRWGFLPFFAGEIEGFSIEELISPDYWFPDGTVEGVWEWKNDIIIDGDCAYGKFYRNKACFISMEWFPDFANWRRSLYVPSSDEQAILSAVVEKGSLLSRELKRLCGYTAQPRRRGGNPIERAAVKVEPAPKPIRRGFDSAIARLQMGCQLLSATFEYNYDREGQRYGWSIARYCTPEEFFGEDRMFVPRTPEESRRRLVSHLSALLHHATDKQVARIVD
ncbi:MAG: hypothetical protein IJ761_04950 [Bacteroidales bacterium]|nr:hypothetical protein [Bacteroidales bacterium]